MPTIRVENAFREVVYNNDDCVIQDFVSIPRSEQEKMIIPGEYVVKVNSAGHVAVVMRLK